MTAPEEHEAAADTPSPIPALQIRHTEGSDWCVAAKWADGHVEDIATFGSERDANEWIVKDFQAWLDARKNGGAAPRYQADRCDA
jgi:hypothetical protein